MFGIELMRLLGGREMELDTYRMRDGNVLVIMFKEFNGIYEVSIYNRSDIEERSWEFHEKAEAMQKFEEVKMADAGPIHPSGAKR